MADTLRLLATVFFLSGAALLLIAAVLWFVLKIPKVIGDLSGRTARKNIRRIREENEQAGRRYSRPVRAADRPAAGGKKKTGHLTARLRQAEEEKRRASEEAKTVKPALNPSVDPGTVPLQDNDLYATMPLAGEAGFSPEAAQTVPESDRAAGLNEEDEVMTEILTCVVEPEEAVSDPQRPGEGEILTEILSPQPTEDGSEEETTGQLQPKVTETTQVPVRMLREVILIHTDEVID